MKGIGGQIHDNLVDLGRICIYGAAIGMKILRDGYGGRNSRSDEFQSLFNDGLHLHQSQLGFFPP